MVFGNIKQNEVETRQLHTTMEVRDIEGDSPVIEGYALKFNTDSEVLGGFFRERIDSKALVKTDMSNVVALFNHNEELILGRSGANLTLEVDEIGLRFQIKPIDTSYTRDLMANMKAGIINQCSFAMSDISDEFGEEPDERGIYSRTIRSIGKLHDVAIVTTPAYSDTEVVVGKRSYDKIQSIITPEKTVSYEEMVELLDYETYF